MIREALENIDEGKLVTLILQTADGKSLVPKGMKDNKGYPTYTSKRKQTVEDLIAGHGLQEQDGELVLKEVGSQRVEYYSKLLISNFDVVTKQKITVKEI